MTATSETIAGDETKVALREDAALAVNSPHKAFLRKSQAELEEAVALYPEDARIDTIWAQGFCREQCKGNIELLRAVAEKLGFRRSQAFFYNALLGHSYKPGKGKGDVVYWRELVRALREHDRMSTQAGKLGFIETPTYRCYANFVDELRAPSCPCKFGVITGPTGGQKTACRKYYRLLNNHGRVVGLEAPARKSIPALQRKLAAQYNAKTGNNAATREEAIRDNLNDSKTIIIDNAQRLYIAGAGNKQPIFDYLLELQEDTNCTVVLHVTEDFVTGDLTQGAARNYFEQLVGRFGGMSNILRLPAVTPLGDIKCIARAYGLRESAGAIEMMERWAKQPGKIRILFHRLNRARTFAKLDGRDRITLSDLAEANEWVPPSIGEEEEAS